LAQLREPEKLRSWLCRIARNLTCDAVHQDGREPCHRAESLEEVAESHSPEPLPVDRAISNEEQAILWRSIERIPEIYREPLVLFYREHQSVEAVAHSLELSEDTVRQRLSRGRKMLHEEVLAFVEGALERTNPGKAFTVGVLAALPVFATSAKAATVEVTAAKGGAAAKAAASAGLFGALFVPVLGFFGNYIRYRIVMELAQTDQERERINRFYRKLIARILGFFVAYGLLMIWAWQIITNHDLVYTSLVVGLMLPVTFVVFANGIWWWQGQRQYAAALAKGANVPPAQPSWEYRGRLGWLGLPFIHIRVSGGLAAEPPIKAWIAVGDCAVGGLFAFGRIALAPVCMGGLALGLLPFGGCAAGLLALGGFSVGVWAFGGLALGWKVAAGCAIAWQAAMGGVAIAHDYAMGGLTLALQANNDAARSYFQSNQFFQYAPLALRHLLLLILLWIIPMLAWWRVVVAARRRQRLGGR
jgi:RNA polymerase sigma factor (sigma-70 family)